MLNKLKYFILGVITATLVNVGLGFADEGYFQLKRVDYPIFVNGVETNLESLIFNYEGSTYIPLRKVAEVTGSSVIWNNNLKSVIITNTTKETIKEVIKEVPIEKIVYVTPKPTLSPTPTPIPIPMPYISSIISQNSETTTVKTDFLDFLVDKASALSNSDLDAIEVQKNIKDKNLVVKDKYGSIKLLEHKGFSFLHFNEGYYYCGKINSYDAILIDKFGEVKEFYTK